MWRAKKEGKGKKKVGKRKTKGGEGKKLGFQQCYVLKTFPSTLKDEGKGRKKMKGEEKRLRLRGEEKRCAGKGRKYFQRCWGRFSTMLCLETFPSTLKNEGKGRKKMHRVGNDDLLF